MAVPIEFPSTTKHIALPLLFSGQAQKEFFINQSLVVLDALLLRGVDNSFSAPPADPTEGQCFRVTAEATDEWVGHEDDIAVCVAGAWHFIVPKNGMRVFDRTAGTQLHFRDGWQTAIEPVVPSTGSTVDAEARTALAELIEALRKVGIFPSAS